MNLETVKGILANPKVKPLIFVVVGLIVLLIIGSNVSKAIKKYQFEHQPTATATATLQPTATKVPPTPIVYRTPKNYAEGMIGETIELNKIKFTVTYPTFSKEIAQKSLGDTQLKFLDVNVTIQNQSDFPLKYDRSFFRVQNRDKFVFNASDVANEPALTRGELAPQEEISGHIAFEISDDSQGISLSYFPLSIREQNEIKVKITAEE